MRYVTLLVPLLALLLAACNGGEEEPTVSVSPSPAVEQPSPIPEPTAVPTPTPTLEPAVPRIAYIGTDGDLWIVNADGSGEEKLFAAESGDPVGSFKWSPDGSTFAVTVSSDLEDIVYIVSAAGDTLLEVPTSTFIAWSPAGDMIVVASSPASLEAALLILDLKSNTVMELPYSIELSFSADGARLAFFQVVGGQIFPEGRGFVADLRTAEFQPIDPNEDPRGGKGPPIFSPTNASLLAYGDRLFDLNAGKERSLPGDALSWSPDGQRIYLLEGGPFEGGPSQRAQVYDVDRELTVLEFGVTPIAISARSSDLLRDQSGWSPDGRLLATFDFSYDPNTPSALHIRSVATGDDRAIPVPKGAFLLRFSPDGQRILFADSLTISRERPRMWMVIDSDGSNLTGLTDADEAAWRPTP